MDKPIILSNLEEWDFTEYIDSLVQKDEAVDLEFKSAKDGLPNSLWDTYSSFANTHGGLIILGVKERKQQFIIEGLSSDQITQYKKDFWNQVNNPECISFNLLTDNDLYEADYKNKKILIIYVPRANRLQRPIHRTRNPFNGHTFKRNNEGDYKCSDAEVRRMIADSDENHPRDSRILANYSMNDIDLETLSQYNGQLQYLIDKHSTEITKMLKSLCQEGYLISEGKGKGTQYRVKEPEAKVGTSEAKVGTSDAKVGTSETKVGTSPKNKDRLSFQELESLIMTITQEYATIEEIATQVNRNLEYLANKIIPKMLEHGTIIRLYPGTPNHPKQKYKANHQQ